MNSFTSSRLISTLFLTTLFCFAGSQSFAGPKATLLGSEGFTTYLKGFKPSFLTMEGDRKSLRILSQEVGGFEEPVVDLGSWMDEANSATTQTAAEFVAKKFLMAADMLVQLEILNQEHNSLFEFLKGKARRTTEKSYRDRIETVVNDLNNHFMDLSHYSLMPLTQCRTRTCTAQAYALLKDLISLGNDIRIRSKSPRVPKSVLLNTILAETLNQVNQLEFDDPNDRKIFVTSLNVLIRMARGEISASQMLSLALDKTQFERIKSLRYHGAKADYFGTKVFLEKVYNKKFDAILGGTAFATPLRDTYRYTYTLKCVGMNDGIAIAGGKFKTTSWAYDKACVCEETQERFQYSSFNLGVGLGIYGDSGRIRIASPTPISLKGTWRGFSMGVGVGGGASMHLLFGKKGSSAAMIVGGGAIGAHVGYSSLTLKPL